MDPVATFQTMILEWDTGASFGLTPFKSNFVDNVECDISIEGLTKVNKVIGIVTTMQKSKNSKGDDVYLPCVSYHIPMAYINLCITKNYHHMHSGNSSVYDDRVETNLSRHKLVMPIDRKV